VIVALAMATIIGLRLFNAPETRSASTGVPVSTGPLDMIVGDIVTTEYAGAGTLRVWRKSGPSSYFEAWKINPVRHTSLAVGDLDGQGDPEIVAPGHCRETIESPEGTSTRIRFFLNAYKTDVQDWWKTTFFDEARCVYEKDNFRFTQIAIGNIDAAPGNEIVLITAHGLSAYRYDPASEEIELLTERRTFIEGTPILLRSLALADLDGDGRAEIVISANEGDDGNEIPNKGWLLILGFRDGQAVLARTIGLEGNTSAHSLRVGQVIPEGAPEIAFPVYKNAKGIWDSYLVLWNPDRGFVSETFLERSTGPESHQNQIAMGRLSGGAGEEIVVARSFPTMLTCLSWNGRSLFPIATFPLDAHVRLTNLFIDDTRRRSENAAYVLACGNARLLEGRGHFYVELIRYSGGFFSLWNRTGGAPGDLEVSYAGFVKKPLPKP
jgi:hypothetical protein